MAWRSVAFEQFTKSGGEMEKHNRHRRQAAQGINFNKTVGGGGGHL